MPLIIAVVVYIFLEVMVTSLFVESFGSGMLFLEIILTALMGVTIITNMKNHLREALALLQRGLIDPRELMLGSISRVVGGILCLLPGVLTDLIGVLLLLRSIKKSVVSTKEQPENNFYKQNHTYSNSYSKSDEIIDVEVVEDEKGIK